MLTNEQCIEVAEKVWGWKCKPREDRGWYIFSGIDKFNYEYTYPIDWLRDEVNSWQGFGRTVEAMFGKGKCVYISKWISHVGFNCMDTMCMDKNHISDEMIDDELEFPEHLWEATHLAALEAMKND